MEGRAVRATLPGKPEAREATAERHRTSYHGGLRADTTPSSTTSTITRLNSLLGSCTIKYGYIITIFKIESIENGVVNQKGEAIFTVSFKALVFRPLKGEVLDGIVEGVEKVGLELSIGVVRIFVPHTVF